MTRSFLRPSRVATFGVLVLAVSAPSPTLSLIGTAYAADAAETTVVEVDGYGADPQRAQENGLREAVQRVVGTFVATDALMEKGDLLQDKVYAHSRGFVETIEVLDTTTRGKLVVVKMKVTVRNMPLRAAVAPIVTSQVAADGLSLGARLATKLEQNNSSVDLFMQALQPFKQVWTVTLGTPDIKVLGNDFELVIPYTADVNTEKWKIAADNLRTILDQIAVQKTSNPDAVPPDQSVVGISSSRGLSFNYWVLDPSLSKLLIKDESNGVVQWDSPNFAWINNMGLECKAIATFRDGEESTLATWSIPEGNSYGKQGSVYGANLSTWGGRTLFRFTPAPLLHLSAEGYFDGEVSDDCKGPPAQLPEAAGAIGTDRIGNIARPGTYCLRRPYSGNVPNVEIRREDVGELVSVRAACDVPVPKPRSR